MRLCEKLTTQWRVWRSSPRTFCENMPSFGDRHVGIQLSIFDLFFLLKWTYISLIWQKSRQRKWAEELATSPCAVASGQPRCTCCDPKVEWMSRLLLIKTAVGFIVYSPGNHDVWLFLDLLMHSNKYFLTGVGIKPIIFILAFLCSTNWAGHMWSALYCASLEGINKFSKALLP